MVKELNKEMNEIFYDYPVIIKHFITWFNGWVNEYGFVSVSDVRDALGIYRDHITSYKETFFGWTEPIPITDEDINEIEECSFIFPFIRIDLPEPIYIEP